MPDTETLRPNLIGGDASSEGPERLPAHSAAGNAPRERTYAIATAAEIARAATLARKAFEELSSIPADARAAYLDAVASRLDEQAADLAPVAHVETALPMPRLTGEIGRTTAQLRMFARLIREGSWVDARIDLGDPDRKPAPKPDVRRMLIPIGPVAVFGASNFPFAFSVAGGDTASALAAGCPVIAKAHPAHPETSHLVGSILSEVAESSGMPVGMFSLLQGGADVGSELARADAVKAVAFTGSLRAGRSLYDLAAKRPNPIPVFAEMGSVNPVFVLPHRVRQNGDSFTTGYSASLTLGVGQFCTNPGLLIGVGSEFEDLLTKIAEKLNAIPVGTMLTEAIKNRYHDACQAVPSRMGTMAITDPGSFAALFKVEARKVIDRPELVEEIFGPAAIALVCESEEEMVELAATLPGQLTATIQAEEGDRKQADKLLARLVGVAGRIVFNSFPTGVEVGPAMQHGGPYPATTDSRFTSVGTGAILRFVRPVAFQDLPESMLPLELQNTNPLGILRTVNGEPTH